MGVADSGRSKTCFMAAYLSAMGVAGDAEGPRAAEEDSVAEMPLATRLPAAIARSVPVRRGVASAGDGRRSPAWPADGREVRLGQRLSPTTGRETGEPRWAVLAAPRGRDVALGRRVAFKSSCGREEMVRVSAMALLGPNAAARGRASWHAVADQPLRDCAGAGDALWERIDCAIFLHLELRVHARKFREARGEMDRHRDSTWRGSGRARREVSSFLMQSLLTL